jgi:hypothetical protein
MTDKGRQSYMGSRVQGQSNHVGARAEVEAWESPRTLGDKVTSRLYVFVDDLDAHYERASGRGKDSTASLPIMVGRPRL